MLERAAEAKRLTGGAFDVHFAGDLEPSGLVKSWAADRAGALLAGLGLDWYVNAAVTSPAARPPIPGASE